MAMLIASGTLARYFGWRFVTSTIGIFIGILALSALIDYIELMRRGGDVPGVTPGIVAKIALFRMPQLGERLMPFCVLIGTMSCYLNLSRRNELVVARAAGISAWQFVMPAALCAFVLGVLAVTAYNPISASLQERAKRLESKTFSKQARIGDSAGPSWIAQRSAEGKAFINAASSAGQGVDLSSVTIFKFDNAGTYVERLQAQSAVLGTGVWHLADVRSYRIGERPQDHDTMDLPTNLTREQVRENFATPESVPFWDLPEYIQSAGNVGPAAAGYRLQFQKLIARPFLLAAVVFLAAAVSLRFFRFGGVQKLILGGILAGFLLYVLSKIADDMATVGLMPPVAAAWVGVLAASVVGVTALLCQEDG